MGDPPHNHRPDDQRPRDARFEDPAPEDGGDGSGGGGGRRPTPRQPLPLRETAAEVLATFLERVRYLPTVALVPFTLTFVAQGGLLLFTGNPLAEGPGAANPLLMIGAALAILVAYVVFLVDWHRLVLLGPSAATTRPRLRPQRRDLRFFGQGVLVGVLALLAALPAALLAPGLSGSAVGTTVLLLLGLMLNLTATMALGLVLPATATGRNYSIGASLQATREVLPQIAGLVGLVLLPGLVIVAAANSLYALAFGPSGPVVPGMLLSLVLEFAMMALAATLLSVIFRRRAGVDLQA